ncbi:MAG: MBL fold metallo-hydrolase [Anaerolineales bacterium]|uniref:MBL fold metallo-hydrolase n=1 Tax=Candidatus Desulfolinea nitratireducens TaxID=2841698 RepID=A0A8J6NI92_9CHLR|nr:MBL fold metallo-hydrolase [Candidatus Desulfolinea nitratireducens]MBL6961675.1 MBL fold metallo-hydrolase [Anaerolineales bacterium]
MPEIKRIDLMMPFKLGRVNCYLLKNDSDYILIDTGSSNQQAELEEALENEGCMPGNLKLIILTHGDFDHTGNVAYLSLKFGTQVAMHIDDSGMAEYGNMFFNRKEPNILIRKIIPVLSGFGKKERFRPDLMIEGGDDLSAYGFDAEVISIPGHSRGSIGILTANGDFFCGDLFENMDEPSLNSIMDESDTANASIEKLTRFKIKTVYPGHGKPFLIEQFNRSN